MPPPKDLPGFYYDAEKNRYFPIKGPIPGSKRTASAALATCSSSSKESKIQVIRKGKRIKISDLLGLREIQGRDILFNSRRYYFQKQYEEIQASQPTVWKFESTKHVHHAIERVCIQLHTETGTRNALLLAASRNHDSLSFFHVDNPEGHHLNVESVWLPRPRDEVSNFAHSTSPSLSLYRNLRMPSEVSCIKLSGGLNDHVLVTTLGSGESKGSLFSFNANVMSDILTPDLAVGFECLFSMDGTVWTADCNSAGTYAALGTSMGSALFDLEARSPVRIYRSKSDVLSQQFISSGNVVLCGLRNGSILTIDTREKQIYGNTEASDWSSANPRITNLHMSRRERRRNFESPQVDRGFRSLGHVRMTSAVCSMVSLSSDENYFIASSMDGSIKLFDIRALGNGGVQSYMGHVNSHNHLQLAVNPSETLLLSGGEDCRVRIWSIKTGELLFSEMFSESCCTTVLWPGFQGHAGHQHDQSQSWGAWLGSRDGLFYMQVI